MNRTIFFDRDGILNNLVEDASGKLRAPFNLKELEVNYQARDLINYMRRSFHFTLFTNQPDIGKGRIKQNEFEKIQREILSVYSEISSFLICPHTQESLCACRKPSPKLLIEYADTNNCNLINSWVIGDRWVDIEAGNSAGCSTILLEKQYSWNATSDGSRPADTLQPTIVIGNFNDLKNYYRQIERNKS